jgi:hypothetical protein
MGKLIVIDKEKVERSEHSELIKTAISLLIKHGVATEIDTDKSIDLPTEEEITHHWKRNNCFGHYLEGLEHGSMWMRELSIKQSLIEQMKAKEFAEWCSINGWYFYSKDNIWRKHGSGGFEYKTTEELFNQFANQKQ